MTRHALVVLTLVLLTALAPTALAGCHPACTPLHALEHRARALPLDAGLAALLAILPGGATLQIRCC